jgi:hypothetical protein
MEFKLKKYRHFKIKNFIKTNNFFFIYNGNNLNLKNWIIAEQQIKNLNLKYHKIYNKITKKTLEKSIYNNFNTLINGFIILVKPDKKAKLILKTLLAFSNILTLVGFRLNRKIYNPVQLKNLYSLKYKTNITILIKLIKTSLKISYGLTQNSKISK